MFRPKVYQGLVLFDQFFMDASMTMDVSDGEDCGLLKRKMSLRRSSAILTDLLPPQLTAIVDPLLFLLMLPLHLPRLILFLFSSPIYAFNNP